MLLFVVVRLYTRIHKQAVLWLGCHHRLSRLISSWMILLKPSHIKCANFFIFLFLNLNIFSPTWHVGRACSLAAGAPSSDKKRHCVIRSTVKSFISKENEVNSCEN